MARNSDRLTLPNTDTARSNTRYNPASAGAVAEDHADKQHADEGRQLEDAPRQQLRNHLAQRQTDGDQGDTFDQHQRGDHPPHVRLFKGGWRHLIVRCPVR